MEQCCLPFYAVLGKQENKIQEKTQNTVQPYGFGLLCCGKQDQIKAAQYGKRYRFFVLEQKGQRYTAKG